MKKIVVLLSSLICFSTGINAETLRILAEAGDEATLTRAVAQFEAANSGVTVDASYLGWDDFMATIKLKMLGEEINIHHKNKNHKQPIINSVDREKYNKGKRYRN